MKIRPARRGDREMVASLFREAGYPDAADANTLFWVLNHPELDVFVAVDSLDRAIGLVSLSHRPQLRLRGRITSVDELVVSKAWQRKGIGAKLLAAAVERAKAMSAKRVELRAEPRAQCSRGFFARCGFAETDCGVLRLRDLEK